jgi:hypothetical protein
MDPDGESSTVPVTITLSLRWPGTLVLRAIRPDDLGISVASLHVIPQAAAISLTVLGLANGRYLVGARTIDTEKPFLRAEPQRLRPNSVNDLSLGARKGRGHLSIRVTRHGVPFGGALVSVSTGSQVIANESTEVDRVTWVEVPPDQQLSVDVTRWGGSDCFGFPASQSLRVKDQGLARVDLALPTGVPVRFRLDSPAGEALPFRVSVWRIGSDGEVRYVDTVPMFSASNSCTRSSGDLPPGSYVARIGPKAQYSTASVRFDVVKDPVSLVTMGRVDGLHRRLRFSRGGAPAENIPFALHRTASHWQEYVVWTGESGPDGDVVTPPVPNGQYWLYVWPSHLATPLVLTDADSPVRVELPDAVATPNGVAEIVGHLKEPGGEPAKGYPILLGIGGTWWRLGQTGAGGDFAFGGLAPGRYRLVVPVHLTSRRLHAGFAADVDATDGPVEAHRLAIQLQTSAK